MNVTINKKTELAAVFLNISNYKEIYPHLNEEFEFIMDYKNNIFSWFSEFENSNSIKLFNNIVNELSLSYDAPIELFLNLNDDYTYDKSSIFNENTVISEFTETEEEKKLLLSFLDTLPDFVKNSNFEEYYKLNAEFYKKCIEIGKEPITEFNILKRLSRFIKDDTFYKDAQINLLPFTTGNFGLTIKGVPYPNYGVDGNLDKLVFGTQYVSLVIHEFLHSKVNSLTKENLDTVKNFDFSEQEQLLQEYAYIKGNNSIINEYIVRAIETIITRDLWSNEERYQKRIELEKSGGFIHIERVIDEIEKKNENDKIDEYYEKLLNEFLEYNKNLTSKIK